MAKIAYTNKVALRSSLESAQNLVRAEDLNEIKASVNTLYDEGANQVKNAFGWALYVDTGNDLVVDTSDTLLTIDSNSVIDTYKPKGYGANDLWSANKINAITVGDAFDLRVDLSVTDDTSNPNYMTFKLDIGGGATPSNVVVERTINLLKSAPYTISIGFPIYTLDTFVANGGQFFLSVDGGDLTISARDIFIKRDFTPALQNGG